MTKGRGSNEARRNRRLAGRGGSGSASGRRWSDAVAMAERTKSWRAAEDTWRIGDRIMLFHDRPSLWSRVKARLSYALFRVQTRVAPKRAGAKVERMFAEAKARRLSEHLAHHPTPLHHRAQIQRRQTQRRR